MASSEPATFPSNANVSTRALTTTSPSSSAPTVSREPSDSTEEELIERLRAADPPTVVHLSREMRKQYPKGRFADERDAREVDALLALGQLREAHYRAQLFVQHYPDSPFAQRVVNLMGVHPRPPGVVPEPPDDKESSR